MKYFLITVLVIVNFLPEGHTAEKDGFIQINSDRKVYDDEYYLLGSQKLHIRSKVLSYRRKSDFDTYIVVYSDSSVHLQDLSSQKLFELHGMMTPEEHTFIIAINPKNGESSIGFNSEYLFIDDIVLSNVNHQFLYPVMKIGSSLSFYESINYCLQTFEELIINEQAIWHEYLYGEDYTVQFNQILNVLLIAIMIYVLVYLFKWGKRGKGYENMMFYSFSRISGRSKYLLICLVGLISILLVNQALYFNEELIISLILLLFAVTSLTSALLYIYYVINDITKYVKWQLNPQQSDLKELHVVEKCMFLNPKLKAFQLLELTFFHLVNSKTLVIESDGSDSNGFIISRGENFSLDNATTFEVPLLAPLEDQYSIEFSDFTLQIKKNIVSLKNFRKNILGAELVKKNLLLWWKWIFNYYEVNDKYRNLWNSIHNDSVEMSNYVSEMIHMDRLERIREIDNEYLVMGDFRNKIQEIIHKVEKSSYYDREKIESMPLISNGLDMNIFELTLDQAYNSKTYNPESHFTRSRYQFAGN